MEMKVYLKKMAQKKMEKFYYGTFTIIEIRDNNNLKII